ncbi:uncharacterized protein GLRG_10269 [Colletotrichum graminicola M1.001]|uniref:Uncharacterized protein n=1 Tax=Colletotrichum graminicola (strain M1.001 / M2 / FGSC 10212) TaxID=645133 RepID=E3QW91_COLGM|nr:uncharacterized protein GLRG_10269 [Colletotrichum graminicola M1.001]EFQ35125.1 hypothetical protein GLRG_10269 [Colletotrichum graminicola M1.001]
MLISKILAHLPLLVAPVLAGVIDHNNDDNVERPREVLARGTRGKSGEVDVSHSGTENIGQRSHNDPRNDSESTMATISPIAERANLLTAVKPSATPNLPSKSPSNSSKLTLALDDESTASSLLTETSTKHRAETETDLMVMTGNQPEPRLVLT